MSSYRPADPPPWDVVVVGAGVAGCAAAGVFRRSGLKALVLEGSKRIGGRVHSVPLQYPDGPCVELGAECVHGADLRNPVAKLAREAALQTVADERGKLRAFDTSDGTDLTAAVAAQREVLEAAVDLIAPLAEQHKRDASADTSIAVALRSCGWVARSPLDKAVEWFDFDFEYAAEPAHTSLIHNVAEEYTRDDFGDGQELVRDPCGFVRIVQLLHKRAVAVPPTTPPAPSPAGVSAPAPGARPVAATFQLGETVVAIDATPEAVCVTTAAGSAYRCRAVLLTVSAGVLQSPCLRFTPELPLPTLRAIHSVEMAAYAKVFLEWERPWWRLAAAEASSVGEGRSVGEGMSLGECLSVGEGRSVGDGRSVGEGVSVGEGMPVGEGSSEGMSETAAAGCTAVAPLLGEPHTLLVGRERGHWPLVSTVGGRCAALCFTLTGAEARRVEATEEGALAQELMDLLRATFPAASIPAPRAVRRTSWSNDPLFAGAYSLLPPGDCAPIMSPAARACPAEAEWTSEVLVLLCAPRQRAAPTRELTLF